MYWEITPHADNDYDTCVMPAETEEDHRAALEYAQERLEAEWDSTAYGKKKITITMELCEGTMPEVEDE